MIRSLLRPRTVAAVLVLLIAAPVCAQHGTVVSRTDRQMVIRLDDDYTVIAASIADVVVPDTRLTSAQLMVNSVRGTTAVCTIMAESLSFPPEPGYPVRFDRPVLQGTLSVLSEPEGAALTIDGARLGRTPASEMRLPAGQYAVGLDRVGYEPDSTLLVVTEGQTVVHRAALLPSTSEPVEDEPQLEVEGNVRLLVTSSPSGARILIDGEEYGFTPDPGTVVEPIDVPADAALTLELRLGKHLPVFDTLTVEPGQVWREHYPMEEKRSPMSVLVYPWGSDVFVDDERIGKTPLAADMTWGYHTVRVERPGFATFVQDSVFIWGIKDQNGESMVAVVEDTMQRELGWIRVRSGPVGMQVRLDGVAVGQTPLDLRVPPKTYTVILEENGTQRHQEQVTVDQGDDRRVVVGSPPPD